MNNEKKKNSGGIIGVIAVLLIALVTNLQSQEVFQFIILLAPLAVLIGLAIVLTKAIKKGGIKAGEAQKSPFSYSSKKEKAVEDSPFTATKQGRNISYNEHAAEENFRRDKERRIRQLDVFLKNGIIEKNEYRLLKERYEKQG